MTREKVGKKMKTKQVRNKAIGLHYEALKYSKAVCKFEETRKIYSLHDHQSKESYILLTNHL